MHAILDWMKGFLVLYLVLTILMHLTAAEEYKKYLRFLSGVLLLLVLITPLLHLFGADGKLKALQTYDDFWEDLDTLPSSMQQPFFSQDSYILSKYEDAIAADILSHSREQEIPVSQVNVHLSGDYTVSLVTIWLDTQQKETDPSAKEKLISYLQSTYELSEEQIFLTV